MTPHIHIAVAGTALFAASLTLGCSSQEQPKAQKHPIPVKVRAVNTAPDVSLSRYSGSLEPAVRVDLAFRVNGYVETLGQVPGADGKPRALEVGDFVKQGTLLARIRSSDYSQKVASARAAIAEARSDARLAEAELLRAQKLFETKAISKAELDTKVAKAEYSRANVDAASARAGEAGVALDDTVLKAPMDGVILSRDLEIGSLISPGKPVLTVADTRTVKALFSVPQALVEKLSVGSPLTVNVGADGDSRSPQRVVEAKVTRIAPAADSRGRVFAIEAELPNPSGALRPGSVISVHVPEATLASAALSVPLSAVVRAPGDARGFAVFVVDDEAARSKAHSQRVELGEVLGNSVTVVAGLRTGQRVVTVGSTLIQDGSDTVVIP
jgi:multidrug efflux system membrane fusion protein